MNLIRKLNYYNKFLALFAVILGMSVFQSCQNNPNDLGLEFILSDTLNTKLLDSNKDSLLITSNNYKKFTNTYLSGYFMVGKYQGYESKALLRAVGVSNSYAGATILSASLKFNYAKYAYLDTNGTVSFGVYPLNANYNFTSITYDSINSGSIGSNQLGTYTGTPHDTGAIYIPFDVTAAKNWLEYAADTGYTGKNYGVALVSNSSSNTIKGFGGYLQSNLAPNLVPKIVIVANKNNKTDTLIYDFETLTLTNVTTPVNIPDRFVIQNGISFYNILNFNLAKLPPNSIINEAYLRLKLDKSNSNIASGSPLNLYFAMMTDTATKTSDGVYIASILEDSITISVRLNYIFQKWNYGLASNYGITMKNGYDALNLDKFVFYGPGVQDTLLKPKLLIRYTPKGK